MSSPKQTTGYLPFLLSQLSDNFRGNLQAFEKDGLFVARSTVTLAAALPTHDHFSFILPEPTADQWTILVDRKKAAVRPFANGSVLPFPPFVSVASENEGGRSAIVRPQPYHVVFVQMNRFQALAEELYDLESLSLGWGQKPLPRALGPLLDRYLEESGRKDPGQASVLQSLETLIQMELLRSCLNRDGDLSTTSRYPGIKRALRVMRTEFDTELPLPDLARIAGLSLYRFIVVFRDLVGTTPHAYLTTLRLQAAAGHLRAGSGVTETSLKVGFHSLSGFEQAFKRRYGMLPGAYRSMAKSR